jgi:hypothetical protein
MSAGNPEMISGTTWNRSEPSAYFRWRQKGPDNVVLEQQWVTLTFDKGQPIGEPKTDWRELPCVNEAGRKAAALGGQH